MPAQSHLPPLVAKKSHKKPLIGAGANQNGNEAVTAVPAIIYVTHHRRVPLVVSQYLGKCLSCIRLVAYISRGGGGMNAAMDAEIAVGASWPIENDIGVVPAQLKFRCWPTRTSYPSLNLIMRRRSVWRIDLVSPDQQKANPIWAQSLGLPEIVLGSHCHEWTDNRENIRQTGDWQLPARRPLPHNITTLEQLLPWFAERINLELGPDQRGFDVPPQAELV